MLKILLRVLSAHGLAVILKIIGGFVFPRYMSVQAYAEYQTFSLYLSYLPILTLGIPAGMFVRYGGQSSHTLDKARYKCEFYLLSVVLISFTALFFALWLIWRERMLFYITLCIIPYCLVCSYLSLYQTWGEFSKYNRLQLITSAVPITGSFVILLAMGRMEADWFIRLFIAVYLFVTVAIVFNTGKMTKGVKTAPILDKDNLQTWRIGLAVCIGSYIHVVIHSLDKQIVKLVFDTADFARYSFALSLQSVITVFITALSQPLYYFMAKEGESPDRCHTVPMRLLLMLGAGGGVALHICKWIVSRFLPSYIGALDIVTVYFTAFPAMAVIHCLFINLYKLRRETKQYVLRLTGVLVLSVALNVLFILWRRELTSVAMATVMVYYIWLIADVKHFPEVSFSLRDGVFLMGCLGAYALSLKINASMVAGAAYCLLYCPICLLVYRTEVMVGLKYLFRKNSGV